MEKKTYQPPPSFRPLLWSFKWSAIDTQKDKEDIIVNTINEGTIEQWKWLIATYGTKTVRHVLKKRLASEFHSESRHLATVVFSLPSLRYARKGTHS